jgi:hypothetical protein
MRNQSCIYVLGISLGLTILTIAFPNGLSAQSYGNGANEQQAKQAVINLLSTSSILNGHSFFVSFTVSGRPTTAPQSNGFVGVPQAGAASDFVPDGIMEIMTNGRIDAWPRKSGPGSDWNEEVSLRVLGFRIYRNRWSNPHYLAINTLQWTVASSGGNIQVLVRPEPGTMGVPDEGLTELIAKIFNVNNEVVSVSKPQQIPQ